MTKITSNILLIGLLFASLLLSAQTAKEIGDEKCKEAIKLMDNGHIEESLALLDEALKLDPGNRLYLYETGYAYYLDKQFEKCISIYENLVSRADCDDKTYQMLGNSYDMNKQPDQALDAYQRGIAKFPTSGRLYLESGIIHAIAEKYNEAVASWEKGIDVDPTFPSNYFRLGKLFLSSEEKVWGLIYGELFMNLERNSARAVEMSQLIYNTYRDEIKLVKDTTKVSFSKVNTIVVGGSAKKLEFPFPMIFETIMLISLADEKAIDIHSLSRTRTRFVNIFYDLKHHKKYPNVLYDFQKEIQKEGHLEAYHYWILSQGDSNQFNIWREAHQSQWDSFVAWFKPNPIKITNKTKFLRN